MKEGWEYKKLGEVADFYRGLTYGKSDEAESSNVCVLRSNNIDLQSMSLNLDEIKYLKPGFVIPEDKKLKGESIFICMSNGSKQHVGKVAYIPDDMDYAFGGFMGLIVPKGVSAKYIYYVCCSSLYREFLSSIGNGIGITNLRFSDLNNFTFPISDLKQQKKIVSELDLLSRVIEKHKAQLEELDKLAQSIFYDMFGDPVTNEKGWEVKKLKDVSSKITNGNTPKGGSDVYVGDGILFLRSQNVWRNKIVFDDVAYIDDATHEILHHSSLMHNDILITKTGRFNTENSSLGRAALYTGENNMANINGHVYLVRLKPGIDKKYVLYILLSESFRQLIRRVCVGGIDKRQLNKNHIEDFPIILPPLALQQEFAAKVEAIEQMKAKVRQSLKESEELFNSRMDYYFN